VRFGRSLDALGREDSALAGGKAAALGELLRAGLPVPAGYALLTEAYRRFVDAAKIGEEISRLLREIVPGEPESLRSISAAIRAHFDGPLPDSVLEDLDRMEAALGDAPLAVRSSATTEDLPEASFAGQHESVLNVRGRAELADAVRRCWSSLWTERALAYRSRQGIAHEGLALGVVIQPLIDARAAGLVFTANPQNGRRDQIVIEAAWGLGESVVSGQVTPDHWVLDAATGGVLEASVARKELMTVRSAEGTVTGAVPAELQERPVLGPSELRALLGLARRAALHFGAPQDLEWALEGGELWLLQSRPITSLFPLPEPAPTDPGLRVYLCLNLLQGLVEPLTPAGIDVLGRLGRGPAQLLGARLAPDELPAPLRWAAGRIYLDATEALRHRALRRVIATLTGFFDPATWRILESLLHDEPRLGLSAARLPAHPPLHIAALILARAGAALLAPNRARRRALRRMEAFVGAIERESGGLSSPAERRRFVLETPARFFPALIPKLVPVVAPGIALRVSVDRLLGRWAVDSTELADVLRALPHNPTTEMDLALWGVARELRARGLPADPLEPETLALLRPFLARYGHRAVREIDAGIPRWSDDPASLRPILDAYLSRDPGDDPERDFLEGAARAEASIEPIVAQIRARRGRLRARLARLLLMRLRALAGLREAPKFFGIRVLAAVRAALRGLGEDLVAEGRLDRAEDIFWLRFADWEANDLRERAAEHRRVYARELRRGAIPRVMTSEGLTVYNPPGSTADGLSGTAASPGMHEGSARIVLDPAQVKLEPGDVLVARATDPAWTPLFLTAGALVMEVGGIMSHGSVVARECGIPAVVGVQDATRRLRDGERLRVDGTHGIVEPLER
jgi:pyruvate,water dikinase